MHAPVVRCCVAFGAAIMAGIRITSPGSKVRFTGDMGCPVEPLAVREGVGVVHGTLRCAMTRRICVCEGEE